MKSKEQIEKQIDALHDKISKQKSPDMLYTVRLAEINVFNWVLDDKKEWKGL
jgi:hypothetical protein